MTGMDDIKARRDRGIALLNERLDPDWVSEINLDTLDIADATDCVLGQLYGWYGTGLDELDLLKYDVPVWREPHEYGFSVCDWRNPDLEVQALNAAWREGVTRLRAELAR